MKWVMSLLGLLLLVQPVWAQQQWTLHSLGGMNTLRVVAINKLPTGQHEVLGMQGGQALTVTADGSGHFLGFLPGGSFSRAAGGCAGFVAGESAAGAFGVHTHAWDLVGGALRDLGAALGPPDLFSAATSVNCQGRSAGFGDDPSAPTTQRALTWDMTGAVTLLPRFAGSSGFHVAEKVNNNTPPEFVGYGAISTGAFHCALWHADLTIHDCHFTGTSSQAHDLTETGPTVVGNVQGASGTLGFVWTEASGGQLLPPLPGLSTSFTLGINNSELKVGYSQGPVPRSGPPPQEATIWEAGSTTPVRLLDRVTNPTGWTLQICQGVSEQQVIVCRGTIDGTTVAVLALPVLTTTPSDSPTAPKPERGRPGRRR